MTFQKDIFESLKVYGFDLSLMMWVKFAWFVVWCLWHLRFSLLFKGKKKISLDLHSLNLVLSLWLSPTMCLLLSDSSDCPQL